MLKEVVIIFVTAFVLALIFTPLSIKLAPKVGGVDIPKDNRRMHSRPIPRIGGIAIFIGTIVTLLIWTPGIGLSYMTGFSFDERLIGIIIGGAVIFIVGFIDDLKALSAKLKLASQIICGLILYFFSVRIEFFGVPFSEDVFQLPAAVSLIVTVIWVIVITNAINLIDGLDGLAGGIACISSIAIAYTAYIHGSYIVCMPLLAVAGSCCGFLPFNFHPAKTFMGDCGSQFLGFMLAAVSMTSITKSATVVAIIIPVFILALPIFDTVFAIFRRIANKRPIMEADKGHLHHRLMAAGMGQRRSVLTLYCISGIMGVAAILLSRPHYFESVILIAVAVTLMGVFLNDHRAGNLLKEKKTEPAETAAPAEAAAEASEITAAEPKEEKE